MTLAGAPDFQTQNAPTFTPLGNLAINGAAPVTLDVGPVVFPYHQALMFYWVASPISAGSPILASCTLGLSSLPIAQPTNIADGGSTQFALPGALIVNNSTTCVVQIQPSPLGVSPVTGSLFIFGLTVNPLSIPVVRREYIGLGHAVGNVNIALGTTGTVLPAAPSGSYYRIKHLSARANGAAPAAAALNAWTDLSLGTQLSYYRTQGLVNEVDDTEVDVECFGGLSYNNGSTSAFRCSVWYELWPV